MSDPDMGDWEYRFDALGNLTSQTDSRGCEIEFSYDDLDRPTSRAYSGPGACGDTPEVTYTYDSVAGGNHGIGRRTGMTDGSGAASWRFDIRGRLVREVRTVTGAGTYATEWGYNSADLQVWMRYPGGDSGEAGEQVDFSYLPQESLSSVTSSLGTYIGRTDYDASGRIDLRVVGDDVFRTDFSYYPWTTQGGLGRLQQIQSGPSGSPSSLQDLRYTYDNVGDVTRIEDWVAGQPQAQSFTYDLLYRLTTAAATGGSGGLYSETYEYNPTTGNLSSFGGVDYAYEDPDHTHAVTDLDGVERYRYDDAGNQTWRYVESGTYTLTYNAENRLVEVREGGALVAEFTYDGDGNLIREVAGGRTTIYLGGHLEVETGSTPAPTPTATPTLLPTATHTPTPTATGASDLIFADGFESGGLAAWSSSTTDGGDLSATSSAALLGGYGLQALIDDSSAIYVVDESPASEPRYRVRFYIDPNSIALGSTGAYDLLLAYNPAPSTALRAMFRCSAAPCPGTGSYQLRVGARTDAQSWTYTSWQSISDAPHSVEFDWRAASAAGANDGALTLWLDGAQAAELTNIDNDTFLIDFIRFGVVSVPVTSGAVYLDGFESRRQTYIGPEPGPSTPTATPIPTGTATPTSTASFTPTSTNTSTPTVTRTRTPTRTSTPSRTPTRSITPTPTITSTSAPGTGNGLLGQYYDNGNFTWLVLARTDPNVSFWWGDATPAPGVGADTFSVRWTGEVEAVYSETYRFYISMDDSATLWVNGQQIAIGSNGEYSGTISLTAGVRYPIRLDFVENAGSAGVTLSWSSTSQTKEPIPQSRLYSQAPVPTPTPAAGTGLLGRYYDNEDFTDLRLVRIDPNVSTWYGDGSPDPLIGIDTFSIRWTGYVLPRFSETYTFSVEAADGARLWVNNQLVVDHYSCMPDGCEGSGNIALTAGTPYGVRLDFHDALDSAGVILRWSSTTQAREIIPQSQLFPDASASTSTPTSSPTTVPTHSPTPFASGNGLTGEYYDNGDFTWLKVVRTDPFVNFSWGSGSPDPSIGVDSFSVRWQGFIVPRFTETYRFYVDANDTSNLWINGQSVVSGPCCGEYSGTIFLVAGVRYSLRLDYVENGEGAGVRLSWSSPSQPKEVIPASQLYIFSPTPTPTPAGGSGLYGHYFDNDNFTNERLTRTDGPINFNWGSGSPDPLVGADTFSVRWEGYVQPRFSEYYWFYVNHDDWARLYVNGQRMMEWGCCGEHWGGISLTAGVRYSVLLEYIENTGGAVVSLSWSSNSQYKQVIPQSQLFPAGPPTATPTVSPTLSPTPTRTRTATPTVGPTPQVPSGEVWRFYYFAGAQRVAMRVQGDPNTANNGIFYFLTDHLGSTTVTLDADGEPVGELRYRAFGATRFATGEPGTDYRYTGQREMSGIGLYYYRARWFDPALGRFVQADTAGAGDRYAYVRNNPIRYSDPTGHRACEGPGGECWYSGMPVQGYSSNPHPTPVVPFPHRRKDEQVTAPPIASSPVITPPVITTPPQTSGETGAEALFAFWDDFAHPVLSHLTPAFDAWNNYARPVYKQVRFTLPLGGVEAMIGGLQQLYDDRNTLDLNVPQRLVRAFVVGAEAWVTEVASDFAGAVGAGIGVEVTSPTGPGAAAGAGVGFLGFSYGASWLVDSAWREHFNPWVFPRVGLGDWP
jgi:RHS repeat-associated protein